MALKKHQRLTGASAVSRVFRNTKPTHQNPLSMRVLRNETKKFGCAVVVPKGVEPCAVKRNRLRRRILECVRLELKGCTISMGADVVFTTQRTKLTAFDIREAVVLLLKKSGILRT